MANLLAALIEPSPAIQGQDVRRQFRILSAMLLFLVGQAIYGVYVLFPDPGGYWLETIDFGLAILVLYLASRTRHARIGAWMTSPVMHAIAILCVFPATSGEGLFYLCYLIVPVLLGTVFLKIWPTVINALVATGLVVAYDLLLGAPDSMRVVPFGFVLAVSGLIVFVTHHRNLLEGDRRAELIAALEHKAAADRALEQATHQLRIEQLQREAAVLEERNQLAREVHDGLAQSFTGIALQIDAALGQLAGSSPSVSERLERAQAWARHGSTEAREAIVALRSPMTSTAALMKELRHHADLLIAGAAVEVELRETGEARLPIKVGAGLLRVGQEALANAVRHARPRRVRVELELDAQAILLRVQDDGCGFTPGDLDGARRFGLRGMQERVDAMGGSLRVDSHPGSGTTVLASVPI